MKTKDPGRHVFLSVKVIPNASKNAIEGWKEERLIVRIQAVPEKGKANQILVAFLADELGISKSCISIRSGETSRLKQLRIEGVSKEDLLQKWKS
jgi:hypothetical protein